MPDTASPPADHVLSFGPFRLLPRQKQLLNGQQPIRLGSRAMDILLALVQRPAELVSKQDLMTHAWPGLQVADANLTVHIAALRRALGDGRSGNRFIVNVPGRGYRFVAPLTTSLQDPIPAAGKADGSKGHNLPASAPRLIGRAGVVRDVLSHLSEHRVVTIVGTGGIGKTAVAVAAAEEMIGTFAHGVWSIDLAATGDPRFVPMALASALELKLPSESTLPMLVASLKDKELMLLLDNCEHVIEAAAGVAAEIVASAPKVRILATSREPLRIEGERVFRLMGLENPQDGASLNASSTLKYSALELFVERAAAVVTDFAANDVNVAAIARICRKLDGIPLAIEFAAARVDTLGVSGVESRLDHRLLMLSSGPRNAPPRHRTIHATLEWSYQLLDPVEQRAFRALAVFPERITLPAAQAVLDFSAMSGEDMGDCIANLASKSLVVADVSESEPHFRLLEMVREFALAKLADHGETRELRRQHAIYVRNVLDRTRAEETVGSRFASDIANIRAALAWGFGPEGDRRIAVDLAVASAPLWLEIASFRESHGWMKEAIDHLDADQRGGQREMVLQTLFGLALMFGLGANEQAKAALERANEIAEDLRDSDYQLRALAALSILSQRIAGDALRYARRAEVVARGSGDAIGISIVEDILAASLFFFARYDESLEHARQAYTHSMSFTPRVHIARIGRDTFISSRAPIALGLWTKGLVDQATKTTQEAIAAAEVSGHPNSLCLALTWCGCLVFLRTGDWASAERSILRLKEISAKYGLGGYHACGLGFEAKLLAKRGDASAAENLLRDSLMQLKSARFNVFHPLFLCDLAEVTAARGQLEEAKLLAEEAVRMTAPDHGAWWMPEALRVLGTVQMTLHSNNLVDAENQFDRSLKLARSQGALSWELRTAISLARLHRRRGDIERARKSAEPVYDRFVEGFQTADLIEVRRLLDELAEVPRQSSAAF